MIVSNRRMLQQTDEGVIQDDDVTKVLRAQYGGCEIRRRACVHLRIEFLVRYGFLDTFDCLFTSKTNPGIFVQKRLRVSGLSPFDEYTIRTPMIKNDARYESKRGLDQLLTIVSTRVIFFKHGKL